MLNAPPDNPPRRSAFLILEDAVTTLLAIALLTFLIAPPLVQSAEWRVALLYASSFAVVGCYVLLLFLRALRRRHHRRAAQRGFDILPPTPPRP